MNRIAGGLKKPTRIGIKSDLEKIVSLDFDKDIKYDNTYSLTVPSGPHQGRP